MQNQTLTLNTIVQELLKHERIILPRSIEYLLPKLRYLYMKLILSMEIQNSKAKTLKTKADPNIIQTYTEGKIAL